MAGPFFSSSAETKVDVSARSAQIAKNRVENFIVSFFSECLALSEVGNTNSIDWYELLPIKDIT